MLERFRFLIVLPAALVGLALSGCGGVSLEARYRVPPPAGDAKPREHVRVVGSRVDGRLAANAEPLSAPTVSVSSLGGLNMVLILSAVDVPGSSDVHIEIDPATGETPFGGLIFTTPCVAAVLTDGTLVVDRAGISARDERQRSWDSRSIELDGKPANAFFATSGG
jgi:hypothetical protein